MFTLGTSASPAPPPVSAPSAKQRTTGVGNGKPGGRQEHMETYSSEDDIPLMELVARKNSQARRTKRLNLSIAMPPTHARHIPSRTNILQVLPAELILRILSFITMEPCVYTAITRDRSTLDDNSSTNAHTQTCITRHSLGALTCTCRQFLELVNAKLRADPAYSHLCDEGSEISMSGKVLRFERLAERYRKEVLDTCMGYGMIDDDADL